MKAAYYEEKSKLGCDFCEDNIQIISNRIQVFFNVNFFNELVVFKFIDFFNNFISKNFRIKCKADIKEQNSK